MKGCRYWRTRFPEALYGELDAKTKAALERHFAGCPECARAYEGMAGAVRRMEARPAPDRSPDYWDGYWDRLESRMAREAAAEAAPRRPRPRLAWAYGAAGAVVLVGLGILLGRTVFRPAGAPPSMVRTVTSGTVPVGPPATGTLTPALDVRASRYLRRSRTLLLAVLNTDTRGDDPLRLSLPLQKKTSESLLQEASALKKELGRSDRRLEQLVSDLEMVLLQIANLKPDTDVAAIEIIKAGVESRDLLFKINLREAHRPEGKPGAVARRPGNERNGSAAVRLAAGA